MRPLREILQNWRPAIKIENSGCRALNKVTPILCKLSELLAENPMNDGVVSAQVVLFVSHWILDLIDP